MQQLLNIPDVSGPLSSAWISLQMKAKLSPYSCRCHHWHHLSPAFCSHLLTTPQSAQGWLTQAPASLKALATARGVTHSYSVPCPHGAGQVFHYPTESGFSFAGQLRTVWLTCTFQEQAGFFPLVRRLTVSRREARQTLYSTHSVFTVTCGTSSREINDAFDVSASNVNLPSTHLVFEYHPAPPDT